MFYVNKDILVEEFEAKIDRFYTRQSKSIQEGDLPFAFKLQYCNRNPMPNLLEEGELILN